MTTLTIGQELCMRYMHNWVDEPWVTLAQEIDDEIQRAHERGYGAGYAKGDGQHATK